MRSRTGNYRPCFFVHQRVFELFAGRQIQVRRSHHPGHLRVWTRAANKRLCHCLADYSAIEILKVTADVRLGIEIEDWRDTHHYPSVEVVRVIIQCENRAPVYREDSPNHVGQDEQECPSYDLKVEWPCPDAFWVLVEESVGKREIFGGTV